MKKIILFSVLLISIQMKSQVDTLLIGGSLWGGASKIQDLLIDNNNNYWLAYANTTISQSGVKRYDGANWIIYQTTNSGLPNNRVNAIIQDANNNYWFGTNGGLAKFDGVNWITYNKANSGICSDTVYAIKEEGTNLWLGTQGGISKFDGVTWTTFNTANSGLTPEKVTALEHDGSQLYIGTESGLSILNSGITNYPSFFQIGNITSEIKVTPNNGIVIATFKGAYKFSNGSYELIEDKYDLCDPSTYFSFSATNRKKYIEQNILNGFTINYGNSIREFNGASLLDISETSGAGIIKLKNGKYHVLKFVNSAWSIIRVPEVTNPSLFTPVNQLNLACSSSKLDINQVSANMLDRGDMFWDLNSNSGYEVPKGSGSKATFAGSIWIGGMVGSQLRTACQTYRQNGSDFWPGPLDTVTANNTGPVPTLGVISKINRFDIEEFVLNFNNGNVQNGSYIPAYSILNWPVSDTGNFSRLKAPYVDVNNNGVYDPLTGGDYPEMKGDQMLYHIYNDASGNHLETGSVGSLGIEVRQKSYAYNCTQIADSMEAINYTTFYDFEIINRSNNIIDSMHIGFWNDVDLGFYNDDYVGCNVNENYGYVCNGDNYDEDASGAIGYKNNLPCFSTAIIDAPLADLSDGMDNDHNGIIDEPGEKLGMSSFLTYANSGSSINGNPTSTGNGVQYYRYLNGRFKDGSTMKYGGDGVTGIIPTTYLYPGTTDPIGFGVGGTTSSPNPQPTWTEVTAANTPGDRRLLVNLGKFTMLPKATIHVVYALVFTQGTSNQFEAVQKSEADVKRIKAWYNNNNFPSCLDVSSVSVKELKSNELAVNVYPNPTTGLITIETEDFSNSTKLVITDLLGKTLVSKQMNSNKEIINMSQYESGIYFIKVYDNLKQKTIKVIKS